MKIYEIDNGTIISDAAGKETFFPDVFDVVQKLAELLMQ